MFCLMCGPFLVGTAFFIVCGPIFVFSCGYLYRVWLTLICTRFIRNYVYNLALCGCLFCFLPHHLHISFFISLPACLSFFLSLYPFVWVSLSLCISFTMSISVFHSLSVSVCRSLLLCVCVSLSLSVSFTMPLSVSVTHTLSVFLSLALCFSLSLTRSVFLSLSRCVCHFIHLSLMSLSQTLIDETDPLN